VEQWEVNEQLLLTSLRKHDLAELLERQLAFSRAIMASLAEGVYAVDQAGRVTFANPAAEQMLGWMEADLLGQDADAVVPVQGTVGSQTPAASPLLDLLRTGMASRNEDAVFTRRDGTSFPVAYSAVPLVTGGQVRGAVVTFRDMTEVQRLHQVREEYIELLSHDLRSPLATISGSAELLEARLAQQGLANADTLVSLIMESSTRMLSMIEDVLDRSHLEMGQAELHLTLVDLVEVVRQIVEQIATPRDRERIHVAAVAQLPVVMDRVRIERVLVNLLSNALHYSPRDSLVVVWIAGDGEQALVSVTDQGVGIDPNDLPHLFEKYYRARTAEAVEGSGLGL
jgi:PAS domain S-box-containing protein